MRLTLDLEAKSAEVRDPLNDPENAEVKAHVGRRGFVPCKTEHYPLTESWVFWLRRCLDAKLLRIVRGVDKLPKSPPKPAELVKEEKRYDAGEVEQLRALVAQQGEQITQLVAAVGSMMKSQT